MRQQELTTRQRKLARLAPQIILRNAQLDTHISNLIPLNAIRQPQWMLAPRGRLGFDVGAELPHAFEEGDHGVVEAPVHEG